MANFTPTLGDYTELKPFRFWCQKVLPLVYDDSLSYYELLCKVVDYLNKTMEDVDTMHTDVVNLHEAYVQLQGFVNDYFDNLDVQQEIDNKLDTMAQDGSLSTLISPFIPDIVSAWLNEHITPTSPVIDNTLTVSGAGADAKKTGDAIANQYNATTGVYNIGDYVLYEGTLYKCISEITTPELWNSSHWKTVNIGNEIGKSNSSIITAKNNVYDNIGVHIDKSTNLMPIARQETNWLNINCVYEDGIMVLSGTSDASGVTSRVEFNLFQGTYTIIAKVLSGVSPALRVYEDNTVLTYDIRNNGYTFAVKEYAKYSIRFASVSGSTESCTVGIQLSSGTQALDFEKPSDGSAVDNVARNVLNAVTEKTKNLLPIDSQTYTRGNTVSEYSDGVCSIHGASGVTNPLDICIFSLPSGTYTAIARFRTSQNQALLLRNLTDGVVITYDLRIPQTFTIDSTKNMLINMIIADPSYDYNMESEIIICKGEEALPFEKPSYYSAVDLVARDFTSKKFIPNRISGKKLVTAGDSITYGDGATAQSKTYGALSASALNMKYLNIAMSGRTMADISVNGVTRNGFSVDRYRLVPDDTDYLTIMFGFNDGAYGQISLKDDYCMQTYNKYYSECTEAQKAAVDAYANWEELFYGDVNSTDPKTWSGAWNTVLEYFVVTKSIPHIGVILEYGIDDAMNEIVRKICKKYAVPYIDSTNVQDIPTLGYSYRADNSVNIHNRALYTYDGLHPNDAGYERMSGPIIDWLQRI